MSLKGRRGRQKESENDIMMEAGSERHYITGFEDGERTPRAQKYRLPLEPGKIINRFFSEPPERNADLPTPDFSPETCFRLLAYRNVR